MDGMPGAIPTGAFGQLNANFESAVEDNRWPFISHDSDRGRRSYRPDEASHARSSTRGSQSRHRRPRNSARRMTWTSNVAALQDDVIIPPHAPWVRTHAHGPPKSNFKARSRRANLESDINFRESWDFDAEYNLPMEKEILKELEHEDSTNVSWEALPQLPEEKEFSVEVPENNRLSFLPTDEREVLERQIDAAESEISYFGLFRYATRTDLIIVVVSLLAACVAGAAMPLMTIVYGNLSGTFQGFFIGTVTRAEFTERLNQYTLYFVYLAIGMFVTTYVATTGFIYVGQHVTQKIREHYLAAILRQNIGYFDALGAGEMTTRITSDINLVQEGISEKIGLTVIALATFIAAFVIGFIKNWRLTLILSSTVWAITLLMGGGSTFLVKFNKLALGASAEGASVAEEVLSSVRNAVAFGSQEKLAKKFEQHLEEAQKWAVRTRIVIAVSLGGMMGILYLNYGLSFWQGSRYYVDNEITLQELVTINLAIILGAFALGNVAPNSKAFSTAVAAAGKIFSTIDRESPMNPTNDEGETLDDVEGNLQLRNVKHIYPSRPEVVVMDNVTLGIPAGKTTALVGASGSGKSTIIGLLERFYDPVGGALFLDGMDISTLNLRWLRQQMSLVGQEPVLFSTTIFENISYGLIGTVFEEAAAGIKMRMVEQAAKMANAHEFIMNLPEKYETQVGQKGFLLSGGQKQRIAIARAVVKDPKILLLDEATSALDTKSEGVVQSALENAAKGRTTIVIAHRLSTIKNADNIVVMSEGRIIEQGKHSTLLRIRGVYYNLVLAQSLEANDNNSEEGTKEIESAEWQSARSSITAAPTSPVPFLRRLSRGFSFTSQRRDVPDADRTSLQLGPRISRRVTNTSGQDVPDALPEYVEEQKIGVEETPQKYSTLSLMRFVASFNQNDKAWMLFGLFWAVIAGGGNPTQAVFFAKSILSLAKPPSEYAQLRSDINFWAEMYIMLAGVQLLSYSLMGTAFAYCSERLLLRARARAFRTMLRQDIAWFDEDKNSAGALTSFLATQTTFLAGLSGATLGTILTMLTTLIAAIALSIAISWKLALVCTACVPILLACGYLRFWMLARFRVQGNAAYQQSASYACEAANAIRTVASLTREQDVWRRYHESLDEQFKQSLKSVFTSSILYAASQSLTFLCIALGFWYGGTQIANGDIQLEQFFICFSAIIFGAQSAGTIFSFAPDMGKAKQAAIELKALFDQKPVVDTWSESGLAVKSIGGAVSLSNVHFNYPTRPQHRVLKGVSLDIKPGQYVALVGASGCGKSTIIALLERFYDAQGGSIFIDGKNIRSMNVNQYRSQIALVGQEPTLYQGTIRENVLLGATSGQENITQSTIEAACRDANILDFIQSLPQGFETMVGPKATLLSGGQKQRLAIARALIRNPKILLLDEATSALDSESEKVVQAALDRASKGRTTISVAHRLSTIRHADVIFVLDGGEVVERGRHDELVRRKGRYAELVALQGLGR